MKKNNTQAFSLCMKVFAKDIGRVKLFMLMGLLHLVGTTVFAQSTIRVSGVVTGSEKETLPSVSIKVKDTNKSVVTSVDGKYIIDVPGPQSVLIFTYIGFVTKEVTVGNRTVINVSLSSSENMLQAVEVVATGYGGVVKKRDLTGAISSVNARQIQERQPINLYDALQGQAAGVLIMNDSGAPGAEGSVQIRGSSTFSSSGNSPLYVIDGVLSDNAIGINPTDIASIEVLKDAASASIYGARAANGVILITTKRGQEGKPRIDVQYSHLFGKLANKLPQSNSEEVRLYRALQNRNGGSVDSLNPSFNADNDLQDLLMGQTAHKNDVRVNISGGQKGLTYYSSANYLDDRSIVVNSYIKRLQGRLNVEYQPSSRFKYYNNLTAFYQTGNEIPVSNTVRVVFDRPANSLIYYPDGSLTGYILSKRNPVANALYEINKEESFTFQFNNGIDLQVLKDLKFTGLFNTKLDNGKDLYFSPRFVDDNKSDNVGRNQMDRRFYYELQGYFNYNKTFGKDHTVTGLLGASFDRRRYDEYRMQQEDIISEAIYVTLPNYINLASNTFTTARANATQSVFARAGYNYKGRYIFNGTFRRDGSSRFGAKNQYGNFFSGSAAWRFSDEAFMSWSKKVLSDAKLRVSIGELGNDGIGDYEHYTLLDFGGSYNSVGGVALSNRMGNPEIKWEATVQKNYGVDLSFLNGDLGVTLDYYDKTTSDLLYDRNIAPETGYDRVRVNLGSVQNKGLEFAVNATPIRSKRFSWNILANISFERGEVTKLYNGQPFIAGDKWLIKEGTKIGSFFGWKNLGVYQWNESNAYTESGAKLTVVLGNDGRPLYENGVPVYSLNGQSYSGTVTSKSGTVGKLKGGDTEWLDINNDGLINDDDQHIIGNATPDYYLGIVNNLTFRQFSFSFIFNASMGGEVYNTLAEESNRFANNTGIAMPHAIHNAWRKPGDIALYPYFPDKDTRGSQRVNNNSLYVEDASFIRLSSARLTYNLKPAIASKFYLKGLSAFVYGTNLATWTNYSGYDPEFSSSNPLTPGDDTGRYPKRRELGLGLNITL